MKSNYLFSIILITIFSVGIGFLALTKNQYKKIEVLDGVTVLHNSNEAYVVCGYSSGILAESPFTKYLYKVTFAYPMPHEVEYGLIICRLTNNGVTLKTVRGFKFTDAALVNDGSLFWCGKRNYTDSGGALWKWDGDIFLPISDEQFSNELRDKGQKEILERNGWTSEFFDMGSSKSSVSCQINGRLAKIYRTLQAKTLNGDEFLQVVFEYLGDPESRKILMEVPVGYRSITKSKYFEELK